MRWILLLLCLCLGCRQPVRTHKLTTKVNDVWASQPKQEVTYSVEWRQQMYNYYYVIARHDGRAYWWGPFTKEEANKYYLDRQGMYDILKIVFDVTPCHQTTEGD